MLGPDAQTLSVEDKIEILKAYMEGGGVKGLIDEEDGEMDPQDEKFINDAFNEIYTNDPKLRALLGDNVYSLGIRDKKQIIIEYKEKGGIEDLLD